ncbi:MAG: DUF3298 and DUF4163 domain-containing protein [Bacteroidales bacterium]|nr:DUF3298 and DUF4163 domain-containing protein [Bacteroidales bacterium]
MKKNILLVITSLILTGLFVTSCFNKNGELKFDNISLKERVYLFPDNDTTKPFANVEIDFTYPKSFNNREDLARLQEIFNGTFFNNQALGSLSPEEALDTYLKGYSEEYREIGNQYYEDMGNLEGDNQPSWYWYQLHKSNEVLFENESILSYSVDHATYTGGAHGSLQVLYYTIDLKNITTITEEDIFIPNYHQTLTTKIVDNLMKKYEVNSPEELLNEGFFDVNDIAPNNNFWISNEGVNYIYNQYEIAPYSMGPIEVTIPYEEIQSIIIPESLAGKQIK